MGDLCILDQGFSLNPVGAWSPLCFYTEHTHVIHIETILYWLKIGENVFNKGARTIE